MPTAAGQPIVTILLAQVLISAILAVALAVWLGQVAAISALLGGAIAVIPNAFLAARLMSARANAKSLLRAAWIGEAGKLVLTVVLFAVVFAAVRPLAVPAVFGGFIAAQLMVLGGLLVGGSTIADKDG